MRIVALQAVRGREWLVLVSLLKFRILRVMTVNTQCRCCLGQMEFVLHRRLCPRLVRQVARIAAHVQRRMSAAALGYIQTRLMTRQTQILFCVAYRRFQKLILVVARVRIVASQAIPYRWRMNRPLDVRWLLVVVTCEAKIRRRCRDQLDARHLFIDSNLMATQAAHRYRRMNRFPLILVIVTLKALGRIRIFIQWHGMQCRGSAGCAGQ